MNIDDQLNYLAHNNYPFIIFITNSINNTKYTYEIVKEHFIQNTFMKPEIVNSIESINTLQVLMNKINEKIPIYIMDDNFLKNKNQNEIKNRKYVYCLLNTCLLIIFDETSISSSQYFTKQLKDCIDCNYKKIFLLYEDNYTASQYSSYIDSYEHIIRYSCKGFYSKGTQVNNESLVHYIEIPSTVIKIIEDNKDKNIS